MKYGPRFLDQDENARCVARIERTYYGFLADRSMCRTDARVWSYHSQGMETARYRSRRGMFARPVTRAILEQLAHPRLLLGRMSGWARRVAPSALSPGRPENDHR